MKPSPAIIVSNLTFRYGTSEVLQDISFDVAEGSYVGLVGPNGGGKTTLLRLLLGLLTPTAGTIDMFGHSPSKAARSGEIGYVPQRVVSQELALPMSVFDMVSNTALLRSSSFHLLNKADRHNVMDVLEELSISHLKDRLLTTLSGGERQRAFIARALVNRPKLLVLDEPTTGIDPGAREEFHELLRRIHRRGVTLMYVSHDTEVIASEATHLLCLSTKLIASCSTKDPVCHPMIEQLYGSGFSHTHHDHHHHGHGSC